MARLKQYNEKNEEWAQIINEAIVEENESLIRERDNYRTATSVVSGEVESLAQQIQVGGEVDQTVLDKLTAIQQHLSGVGTTSVSINNNLGAVVSNATGDHIENWNSQIVSQGRGNEITHVTQQMHTPVVTVDLSVLVDELAKLKEALQREANTSSDYRVIGELADASASAQQGDRKTLSERLKGAGQAALAMASKVGLSVAEVALKQALGLGA
jgi:hypothetical protein